MLRRAGYFFLNTAVWAVSLALVLLRLQRRLRIGR